MRTSAIHFKLRSKLWLVIAVCLACLNVNAQSQKNNKKKRNRPVQVKHKNNKKYEDNSKFECCLTDDMPRFPGGDNALLAFVKREQQHPDEAKGVKGTVVISFIVQINGELTDFKVIRSVHPALDNEALRIMKKMPKWEPGKMNGEPAPVKYNMPFRFR